MVKTWRELIRYPRISPLKSRAVIHEKSGIRIPDNLYHEPVGSSTANLPEIELYRCSVPPQKPGKHCRNNSVAKTVALQAKTIALQAVAVATSSFLFSASRHGFLPPSAAVFQPHFCRPDAAPYRCTGCATSKRALSGMPYYVFHNCLAQRNISTIGQIHKSLLVQYRCFW